MMLKCPFIIVKGKKKFLFFYHASFDMMVLVKLNFPLSHEPARTLMETDFLPRSWFFHSIQGEYLKYRQMGSRLNVSAITMEFDATFAVLCNYLFGMGMWLSISHLNQGAKFVQVKSKSRCKICSSFFSLEKVMEQS